MQLSRSVLVALLLALSPLRVACQEELIPLPTCTGAPYTYTGLTTIPTVITSEQVRTQTSTYTTEYVRTQTSTITTEYVRTQTSTITYEQTLTATSTITSEQTLTATSTITSEQALTQTSLFTTDVVTPTLISTNSPYECFTEYTYTTTYDRNYCGRIYCESQGPACTVTTTAARPCKDECCPSTPTVTATICERCRTGCFTATSWVPATTCKYY